MDLRSYCLLFPQAANRYILRNIDSKSTWTSGATSFLFLRFLMDIRMNIDSKSYMDLRSYFPLFPQASNRYIKRNIDSEPYIDLRSYFLLFPQASNRYIRRNIDSKSTWTSGATSFYFLRLLMDIRRNIDSKPYMDLRSYCLIFPQASNGYI